MEQLTLTIPRMWADHHVLAVREALAAVGVHEVEASAVGTYVRLSFDPAATGRERILQALHDAGYDPEATIEFPQPPANAAQGSAWFAQGVRMTQTNRLDLEMSGDFRKY
ncbi:MAG TPA: heavy-metal-associated domain-containing protein [Anaerolineae bacterium]|nr:heavy-metal-associated domain-containing protein [Anaerolineae bacterium]HOR00321.1 heavy-metal-associated domain-containing protein [Anaerolineae bacterium]HPL30007.1 heavy-metal-associated domain-containing protein [Anaerolineae bacterium]